MSYKSYRRDLRRPGGRTACAGARGLGHDGHMPAPMAELSSVTTALDELTRRLGAMAEAAEAEKDEETSTELYAVERALRGANRRLQKLTTSRTRPR